MSYGFKIMVEGDYACFTRPELKVERVSYDVPTPGALEGLLKSVYWKPAIRYVIDKIIVFHPIDFMNVRRNEVKDKVLYSAVRSQMNGRGGEPCIYTSESRSQRAAMILKNVKYGVEFHFELTGLKNDNEEDGESKHFSIIKRRLEKGQHFRTPCLGCSEFPVKRLELVKEFDENLISSTIREMGDVDLGYMSYRVAFADKGQPVNGDWDNPRFSDKASTIYYRPHMIRGVIDVKKIQGGVKMLIKALCDYYDILAEAGKVLSEGYSKVKIHYLVALKEDGTIDEIINYQKKENIQMKSGKVKERLTPRDVTMPQRTEKPGIEANVAEHRPLYLFGLNLTEEGLKSEDRTGKAQKSHEAFVKKNLEFTEGLDSPLIQAFRNFLKNWVPENEKENKHLLGLGKDYGKSGLVFCLSGAPGQLLHEDEQFKKHWEQKCCDRDETDIKESVAQCAISGEEAPIARIHNKIKGVYGGLATGTVLVGFNNTSENSYGNEQSYNSNISETVMKKYTEALNYLLGDYRHKILLDDVTVVFWAMSAEEAYEDLVMAMLCGQSDKMNAEQTEQMLKELLKDGRSGKLTEQRLQSLDTIQPNVNFYMIGLKPNSSRLALKFIYRRRYGEVLWNIAEFQKDFQVTKEFRTVSISKIKEKLLSPKNTSDKINPALLTKLLEAVLYGRNYPTSLLETVVRRVKTDHDINIDQAGIIKACINRNYKKGELDVALDKENQDQAYVCGRLFAVLEKLQRDAAKTSLNRTIKDAYFASASSKPAIIFPKLLRLAQNHLSKLEKKPMQVYYNKLIEEIINLLQGEFPDTLFLTEQGRFMIGYYQQYQSLFEKKEEKENGN